MGRPKNPSTNLVNDELDATLKVLRALGAVVQQVWCNMHGDGQDD